MQELEAAKFHVKGNTGADDAVATSVNWLETPKFTLKSSANEQLKRLSLPTEYNELFSGRIWAFETIVVKSVLGIGKWNRLKTWYL